MIMNFSFVVPAVLAGSGVPWGDIQELLPPLQRKGIQTIVTLMEQPLETAAAFEKHGIACVHLPIEDGGTASMEQMLAIASVVTNKARRPILVHCAAGIGRTGLMLSVCIAALMSAGEMPATVHPAQFVRQHRPGSIEDAKQFAAVDEFIHHIHLEIPPYENPKAKSDVDPECLFPG